MRMVLPIGLFCGLCLLLSVLPEVGSLQRQALAQDQAVSDAITVDLASGRSFTAEIDPRTDTSEIWLRFRRGGTTILRPIRWDRVTRAHVGQDVISGEQLRAAVETVRRSMPVAERSDSAQEDTTIIGSDLEQIGRSLPAPPEMPVAESDPPRVRSLAIEADVANWDADVEVDGLLVRLFPLDAHGAIVPTRGTLTIDLTAQPTDATQHHCPPVRAGRWAKQVRRRDFGPSGAVYRLPFQNLHPEFDLDLAPYGAVHARLAIPGQGTFDATRSTTRIRPASLVRDRLQQTTGSRFLPEEHTSSR